MTGDKKTITGRGEEEIDDQGAEQGIVENSEQDASFGIDERGI